MEESEILISHHDYSSNFREHAINVSVLICVVFINVIIVNVTKVVRTQFEATSSLLIIQSECMKLLMCMLYDRQWFKTVKNSFMFTTIPSLLYLLSNNLQMVAIVNLNTVVYQIMLQLKIMWTMGFMFLILRKRLDCEAVLKNIQVAFTATILIFETSHGKKIMSSTLTSCVLMLVATNLSSVASVLSEKLLKNNETGFCTRNIQFSLSSILFQLIYAYTANERIYIAHGSLLVYSLGFMSALYGLGSALIIKRFDNIVKVLSVVASLILNVMYNCWVGEIELTMIVGISVASSVLSVGLASH